MKRAASVRRGAQNIRQIGHDALHAFAMRARCVLSLYVAEVWLQNDTYFRAERNWENSRKLRSTRGSRPERRSLVAATVPD
jgi:hypothetical protein